MATANLYNVRVVVPGKATVVRDTYNGDGATTMVEGDLVRIDTSGQIVDAKTGATAAGDVHGMILTNAYRSTAATTSQFVPILKFASDTILEGQLYASAGSDAEPQDVNVGVGYRLRNPAVGIWNVDVANNDGSAIITAKPGESTKWFHDEYKVDVDSGRIQFKFSASVLDGHAA